jgi:hypothetical protein
MNVLPREIFAIREIFKLGRRCRLTKDLELIAIARVRFARHLDERDAGHFAPNAFDANACDAETQIRRPVAHIGIIGDGTDEKHRAAIVVRRERIFVKRGERGRVTKRG